MDVVGFPKLLINDQSEILEQLNQLVRETPHFREAEAGRCDSLYASNGRWRYEHFLDSLRSRGNG